MARVRAGAPPVLDVDDLLGEITGHVGAEGWELCWPCFALVATRQLDVEVVEVVPLPLGQSQRERAARALRALAEAGMA